MTKPKFRFEKPIIKSKTEPASKNVLWYFSQQKKGLTINTIKEYIKSQGWVDLFDTAPIELEEVTFTENGIYENNENGWDKVVVDVALKGLTSTTFTSNGQYFNSDGGWNDIIVEVPLKDNRTEYFISYITSNGYTVSPSVFDTLKVAGILSNIYDNGVGTITFYRPVTSIGESTFSNCTNLTSIIIPNSVTEIGNYAFYNCSCLSSITIPNSVTSIGSSAFSNCTSLISITIPNSVTSIEDYTFYECSSLTSVIIGENVTSIGRQAFGGCSSLTSVTIPNSVTNIGNYAFSDCYALTSIIIPENVTSIGDNVFGGVSSPISITCRAVTPPKLGLYNRMFNIIALYVPAESVGAYKTDSEWGYYSSVIQPIP